MSGPGHLQTLDCAGKHQVLIFVHSRKETAKTARYLKEEALREDRLAQFMRVLHTATPVHERASIRNVSVLVKAGKPPGCFIPVIVNQCLCPQ